MSPTTPPARSASIAGQHHAELEVAYKEFDEAADEVWGKRDDEEDIASYAPSAPRRHEHEADTSLGAASSVEE